MEIDCFTEHARYLKQWANGVEVCIYCAAKHEMAQSAKDALLKAKMGISEKPLGNSIMMMYAIPEIAQGGDEMKLKCVHCKAEWISRMDKKKKPIRCPRCGRKHWESK